MIKLQAPKNDFISQFQTLNQAIAYAKERVKTFPDPLDNIEIWKMRQGFDVVHYMNSSGRNWCIYNKGKKVTTIKKEVTDV
jgi:hypothetical protein